MCVLAVEGSISDVFETAMIPFITRNSLLFAELLVRWGIAERTDMASWGNLFSFYWDNINITQGYSNRNMILMYSWLDYLFLLLSRRIKEMHFDTNLSRLLQVDFSSAYMITTLLFNWKSMSGLQVFSFTSRMWESIQLVMVIIYGSDFHIWNKLMICRVTYNICMVTSFNEHMWVFLLDVDSHVTKQLAYNMTHGSIRSELTRYYHHWNSKF